MNRLPYLDNLRPYLGIEPTNTGRQIFLTDPAGIVTDDVEGLHAVTNEDGRIMLQSGIEFPIYSYRGQPEEHTPCLPTLGRLKKPEEQLLALCRNAAFEDAINEHPFVRIAEQSSILGQPLHIDKRGLAQHYGLATDMLDFTSNFDVASFFATCRWDKEAEEYKPVVDREKPGVLYRISPAFFVGTNLGAEFEIVGWQPLKRPEQQRALGLRLKKGQDLRTLPTVQMVKFRQCAPISIRIWKAFDKGRALFPEDAAADLAAEAQTLYQFTQQQIDKAWERLDAWSGVTSTAGIRQKVEVSSGICISDTNVLNWDGLDMERDEKKLANRLNEVLDKVRHRLAAYPA